MGSTSAGDTYADINDSGLSFDNDEAAKAYSEKHQCDYVVKECQSPLLTMSQLGSPTSGRLTWDQTRLAFFTNLLLDQQRQGKRGNIGWKHDSWCHMLDAFQRRFNMTTSIEQLKARVQVMKKDCRLIRDILQQSGFGWNPVTKMIEATDDIWDAYLKQNKEARKWRNAAITLYNEWLELFDGVKKDGRRQQSTYPQIESSVRSPPQTVNLDSVEEYSAASGLRISKRRCKRSKNDEVNTLEAIQVGGEEYKKAPVPANIAMTQAAMKLVMGMSELTVVEKAKVSNLIRSGVAFATFLEMDHETRLEWIKLELGK